MIDQRFPMTYIDLTHTLHAGIPTWNYGSCGYQSVTTHDSRSEGFGFFTQEHTISSSAGTHMDSPAHCYASGMSIDALPIEGFIRPCRVIHVADRADESYGVSVEDIQHHESLYGSIPAGCVVLVHTGWSARWHDPRAYHNEYRYPSISEAAAAYVVERGIVGLGIDTFSPDVPDIGWPVHRIVLGAGLYILENLTNLDQVPPSGAWLYVLPLKHGGAGESPVRAVAGIPAQ